MSFVIRCQELAASHPEAPAFTFLVDGGQERSLTRGELEQRAHAVARELVARGLRGKRVLLLYVPGLEFVAALLGCLYAGVIAVPAYPPDPGRLSRTLPRLQAIINDCAPSLVLTTSELLAMASFAFTMAPDLAAVPWQASESWSGSDATSEPLPPPAPEELAFLQYTSGSTATPKGVAIGHAEFVAHLKQAGNYFTWEQSTLVSWLPFYHDLGLLGSILFPLWLGLRSILMSPLDFLKRPLCWLQAIDRYRAEVSMAPPFALDLCARRLRPGELRGLDLSCLRTLAIGAEPIHRATLDRFDDLLRPIGFRRECMKPGYGLAEAILLVSGGAEPFRSSMFSAAALRESRVVPAADTDADARWLVSSGKAIPGVRVEIVDPNTRRPCEPNRVGEIWVQGPNVARGYWNRPADTAQTFAAQLVDSDEGPFLRTGDLGFVDGGWIYIASRLKDLIIINGKNHHPQDLEHTVLQSHALLRPGSCAAFSIDDDAGEQLVITAEVNTNDLPEGDARSIVLEQISQAIRRTVSQQHELAVSIVALLAPGQLPKTSSGKIMRQPARGDFLAGRLIEVARFTSAQPEPARLEDVIPTANPIAPVVRTHQEFVDWLSSWLTRRLPVMPQALTAELTFVDLGIDSKAAVTLAGDLATELGQPLSATALYEHANVASLAAHLWASASKIPSTVLEPTQTSGCVVPISQHGSERPVFFLPGIFGVLSAFSNLARELAAHVPIWGLALPAHRGLPTPTSIAALAECYVDELLSISRAAPYRLVGYCSGGMVALEVCRQLLKRGQTIEKLVLLDAPFLDAQRVDLGQLRQASKLSGERHGDLTLEQAVRLVVKHMLGKQWTFDTGADLVEQMVVGGTANLHTFQGYEPLPIDISATLISAAERVPFPMYEEDADKNARCWNQLICGSLSLRTATGNHHSMLQPPHVAELAQQLLHELTAVQKKEQA